MHLHVTNLEQARDATHGFGISSYNISLSLEPGEHDNVTFKADKAGVFPFYCLEFCSALHLEMAGYLIVEPTSAEGGEDTAAAVDAARRSPPGARADPARAPRGAGAGGGVCSCARAAPLAPATSAPARPAACREVASATRCRPRSTRRRRAPRSACLRAPMPGPCASARVTLWGPRDAVIRSSGEGTTVRLEGEGGALLGVTVDGSGGRFDLLDAAVHVAGRGARVEGVCVRNADVRHPGRTGERSAGARQRGDRRSRRSRSACAATGSGSGRRTTPWSRTTGSRTAATSCSGTPRAIASPAIASRAGATART